jgi:hypothetical protein
MRYDDIVVALDLDTEILTPGLSEGRFGLQYSSSVIVKTTDAIPVDSTCYICPVPLSHSAQIPGIHAFVRLRGRTLARRFGPGDLARRFGPGDLARAFAHGVFCCTRPFCSSYNAEPFTRVSVPTALARLHSVASATNRQLWRLHHTEGRLALQQMDSDTRPTRRCDGRSIQSRRLRRVTCSTDERMPWCACTKL